MNDYYGNDNSQNEYGKETGSNSSVYTYIPTEPIEPETIKKREKKKKRGGGGFWKKLGVFLLCGVLFGGAGAGAFIGVMKISGYEKKLQDAVDAANRPAETKVAKVEQAETTPTSTGGAVSSGNAVADVAENAMPSIVAITNTQMYESNGWDYFFYGGGNREMSGSGSGIIVGQNETELLVVTNYHVIAGADSLTVTFTDGNTAEAQVKGTAEDNDLAVIAIPLDSMDKDTLGAIKVATMGDSNSLRVGDEVIAIGNALGYGQSLTYGHVSALSREVTIDNKTLTLLQTDAAINPGNSGGALLNMKGELIGINAAKYSSEDVEGMGFAIPVSEAQDIIYSLMTKQTRTVVDEEDASWLGINGVDMNGNDARQYNMPEGVYIYSIVEDGPAAASELMERDIITAIEGSRISSMNELKNMLSYYAGDTQIELTVQRLENNEYVEKKLSVTLGYRRDYQGQSETEVPEQNR
ncbi:MAG: trypsin-like serine protease [Lachnospiraceae bacterium]|jgi:serine protease Do|nr:trypsin-like serine protease [Lachnospiraceae bacterium]